MEWLGGANVSCDCHKELKNLVQMLERQFGGTIRRESHGWYWEDLVDKADLLVEHFGLRECREPAKRKRTFLASKDETEYVPGFIFSPGYYTHRPKPKRRKRGGK